jgi:CheY-like chemotaxis protein
LNGPHVLDVLVVDDDLDNLRQLPELLPLEIAGYHVLWDYLGDFDEALKRLQVRRYDLLVSDIYRNRESPHKNVVEGDVKARDLVREIRERRFCPVVLFTDGQVPENLVSQPFVSIADKGAPNFIEQLTLRIAELINTDLPVIARRLHDELDRFAGSYVWGFLADRWQAIREHLRGDGEALERIIRRRAAIQLARIDSTAETPVEREKAESFDYYIYPPIGTSLRLGEVLRRHGTDEFRVVLTPHCFLTIQPGADAPRADRVLTARTIPATELIGAKNWPPRKPGILEALRKRSGLPAADVGTPAGRYCFLPGFMEIPDLYCDLMQLESLAHDEVVAGFDRIAVLDTPFAEALQSCLGRLYATVGLPVLDPERFAHLAPTPK